MEKITACLITFKRQSNMPQIIDSLLKWPFISEVLIRDNSKAENIINYGRYELAKRAENELIYVQDDDYIVNDLDKLYEEFMKDTSKLVHTGTKDYERDLPNNIHGENQMALVGWGAFFNREYIGVLDKYIQIYGKDYCFYRETDRIMTLLMHQRHTFIPCDITELPGTTAPFALSQQGDHIQYKKLSIERALTLC